MENLADFIYAAAVMMGLVALSFAIHVIFNDLNDRNKDE